MGNNYIEQKSLVPVISKAKFDDVAAEFLGDYYPEALARPMPVPIVDIARKMGLRVITNHRLSEDFSIFGQMCFTSGLATIYDKDEDEYRDIRVRRGTMLIDPDTINLRNVGCMKNTVAHECVHWYKHRNYHLYERGIGETPKLTNRCPVEEKDDRFREEWTDIDWMEWQANAIAPRILMPKQTFIKAIGDILFDWTWEKTPEWWVVNKVAELYEVSKQSAWIRLHELENMI